MVGVYTGSAVNALTPVADGYDVSVLGSQLALLNATAGTVYHVQVDGYPYAGLPDGKFVLSWNTYTAPAASSAGDFLFASSATFPSPTIPLYIASEWESFPPRDNRVIPDPNSVYDIPTNNLSGGNMLATPGARLTVTRLNGAAGRVLVDYSVTNTFYTNLFMTNIFGTNISVSGWRTSFTTNILVSANYQNNEYGQWVYLPTMYLLTIITGTNSMALSQRR